MRVSKAKAIFIAIGTLPLLFAFQNCGSEVDFSSVGGTVHKVESTDDFKDPGPDDEQQVGSEIPDPSEDPNYADNNNNNNNNNGNIGDNDGDFKDPVDDSIDDELAANAACEGLDEPVGSLGPFQAKYHFGGITDQLLVDNVGDAKINGVIRSRVIVNHAESLKVNGISGHISVRGANHISQIAGVFGDLCLRAESIGDIHGINGGGNSQIAILSSKANGLGQADSITGVSHSDMVIVNFNVKAILGIKRNIHIYGGHVEKIIGVTKNIYLYNGATVGTTQGITGSIVRVN